MPLKISKLNGGCNLKMQFYFILPLAAGLLYTLESMCSTGKDAITEHREVDLRHMLELQFFGETNGMQLQRAITSSVAFLSIVQA